MPHVRKIEIRKDMRVMRKKLSLSPDDQTNLITHLKTCIGNDNAPQTIALYEKVGSEIDPACLVDYLTQNDYQCVFPEIMDEQTMSFSQTPDIIITPLIAFDRDGDRLGQGGGYYDRYFETSNALKIGLAYAEQEVDDLPVEPHDQKLNWILTPKEAIKIT